MEIKSQFFIVRITGYTQLVNINEETVVEPQNEYLEEFFKSLKKIVSFKLNDRKLMRITASEKVVGYVEEWLKLIKDESNKEACDVETEILRFLRICATDKKMQKIILEKTTIWETMDHIFTKALETDANNTSLKVLLQFFINMTSWSNVEAANKIFEMFYDRVKKCLELKLNTYECSALIYYISLVRPLDDIDPLVPLLNCYDDSTENEFLLFFFEDVFATENFWDKFGSYGVEHRLTILEIVLDLCGDGKPYNITLKAVEVLIEHFLKSCENIYDLSLNLESRMMAQEMSCLLMHICSMSYEEPYRLKIQSYPDLLVKSCALLLNVHKLGKEGENEFSPRYKVSDVKDDCVLAYPSFCFKSRLIRLIANMCWKNKNMQDLAREAEVIPVILECSRFDMRNPYITEWCILALRNLCMANKENKKIVASLHQVDLDTANSISVMGFKLHTDGKSEVKLLLDKSLRHN